ncbi:MAG TPA: DeoR/GlpR family DNA-binding transcription regulator [Actinomycetota bacterium]|nr:DeoR/GlpR family DNA-binding transcription regulator [Actinomycetota bacterium]
MHQADRLAAILEGISSDGTVAVADLAGRLDVSAATIRRDLELLEEQRLLTRTHGGAVSHGVLYELPLRYKTARHQEEKRRIAEAAAARVSDGMAVGLTGGTTCTEVGRELVAREHLTVVTNALNIASELAIRPNLKLVVTGGVARPESYELVGPAAEGSLAELNLDLACIGVDGIDAVAGCTTHHEVEAHTNLALIERARHVVVVADSSKIGMVAFARICPVERVHELITDRGADPRALRAIRAAGVAVETV